MNAISQEQAETEVSQWLDFKRVSLSKQGSCAENIARIAGGIQNGDLVLNPETKEFTLKLKFPIGKTGSITELKFKPRLAVGDVKSRLDGVNDPLTRVLAYIGAATGEAVEVVAKMDNEDYHAAADLVIFFMIPG